MYKGLRVVWQIVTRILEEPAASETFITVYQTTQRHTPEDSLLGLLFLEVQNYNGWAQVLCYRENLIFTLLALPPVLETLDFTF